MIAGALGYINGNSSILPPIRVVEVRLQVAIEKRLLAVLGYDGRVVLVES
jgi:hypothetical protein